MYRIGEIIDKVLEYHPQADVDLIQKAYVFTAHAHQGQNRLSGEPYLHHPLEVAGLLSELKLDAVSISAGLLHDVLEETPTSLAEIDELCGEEVRRIVDGVTKITRMDFASRTEHQAENIRKMILAMADDIRVVLVKLSDRMHNMRTLGYHQPEAQRRIARETLDIYAPLAGRLGIGAFKSQLEDLSLYYLEPDIYRQIKDGIARYRGQETRYMGEIKTAMSQAMADLGLRGRVEGRFKHYYSIYRKMLDQRLSLDQLYDLVGFRIILESVKDCYEALGVVHSIWRPIPGRFKDYIGIPKANMYQALHTAVVGPYGERMEIQIRTEEMHLVAESGIASHWRYKEGGGGMDQVEGERFAWLRSLLEWQRETTDPREFLRTLRVDLYPEEVYVFTPTGEVKDLPKGSTPVDFAYAVHSEVGHHCQGARVNGRMVPLRHELKTGDIVEIITANKQHPSKDWLTYVKSPKARARIRQWVKTEDRESFIDLGRDMLGRELKRLNEDLGALIKEGRVKSVAGEFSFQAEDDLLAAVGFGKLSARLVAGRLSPAEQTEPERIQRTILERLTRRAPKKPKEGIKVRGEDGVMVRLAKCCHPLPGEDILGFITRGRGVSVHRADCPKITGADPRRIVEVEWDQSADERHTVELRVVSRDRKGILADIAATLTKNDASVLAAQVSTEPDGRAVGTFALEVADAGHLETIIRDLKRVKHVLTVSRVVASAETAKRRPD
ncbi:MAG: bifunctional (p)ppGpp synthetase/guanosine-3',5'-bis(diphosphate) 3'-pyrophosphohydrolase [Proteobacteria bacterium]|nr:bifunctional (p)ppGpp synthetase/guanosine-3',5'-bis(diphosphate) 3'-pyrophosphohydrolase [Pseudomonadota bacterium]